MLPDIPMSRREVKLHSQAGSSDCIVKLESVYKNMWDGKPSLLVVMEYMEGGDLYYRSPRDGEPPLTEHQACHIAKKIVAAVAHLHRMDLAHRDLKPENFLFKRKSFYSPLKLTDFGFARNVIIPNMLQGRYGSAYNIAPEHYHLMRLRT